MLQFAVFIIGMMISSALMDLVHPLVGGLAMVALIWGFYVVGWSERPSL